MSGALYTIGFVLIAVIPISLIVLIVKAIKKKPKKRTVTVLIGSVILSIVCFIAGVLTDPQSKCDHQFTVIEDTAATCTEDGKLVKECELCGYKTTEIRKAEGHKMTEVSKVNPTDSTDGELIEKCSVCGYTETTVLAKTGSTEHPEAQEPAQFSQQEENNQEQEPADPDDQTEPESDPDNAYLGTLVAQDEYSLMNEDQQAEYADEMNALYSEMDKYCYNALFGMASHTTNDFKPFYEWDYPSQFKKDRAKIFKLFEEVVDKKIVASLSSSEMIKVKSKLGVKHEFIEFIVSDSSDDDVYIYYGESKKGVPDGIGILFKEYSVKPVFAGNFKNGKVKGYGIIFDTIMGQIKFESEDCSYSGKGEFLASGDTIRYITSRDEGPFRDLYNQTYEAAGYVNKESSQFTMMTIAPAVSYEGEMDESKRSGDGKSYYNLYYSVGSSSEASGKIYGQIQYDGEWKYDEYHGKGKLYNEDGSLKYDGKFSNGKIKN